jgi:hypothetical protein
VGLVRTIGTATFSGVSTRISVPVPADGVGSGDRVILAVMVSTAPGSVSCSDSKGNTYAVDSDITAAGRLFVCSARNLIPLTPGDTITATYPRFSGVAIAGASEFSGVTAAGQGRTSSGNNASPKSGAVTTTHPSGLLFTVIAHMSTPTLTMGCGFTPFSQVTGGGGSSQKTIDLGYRIATATGTYSACGTLSPAGQRWSTAIVTYY